MDATFELAAEGLVTAVTAYAGFGLLFAIAFLAAGIHRVDPVAKESGLGFRLLILPGVAALWPLLLGRWLREKAEHS